MKHNTLLLEKIRAGEQTVEELAEKSSVQEEIQKLKESDETILKDYPLETMKNAIQIKIVGNKEKKKHIIHTAFIHSNRFVPLAAAAILALAVGTFVVFENRIPSHNSFESNEIRMKGNGPTLYVYRKNNSGYERLSSNDFVQENDVLQISYFSGNATWGAILSVDGNGNVTQHYPEYGPKAGILIKNKEVSLNFSYRLDAAPFYENFIFFTSEKTFDIATIKKQISIQVRQGNNITADYLKNLYKNMSSTSVQLRK